jgi:hypothetical protein
MGPQVVWTAGDKSILLWCAFSGAYLGALISKEIDDLSLEPDAPSHAEREDRKQLIDPSKVSFLHAWHLSGCMIC